MLPVALLALGCSGSPIPASSMSIDEVSALVRDDVADARGWAVDVREGLVAAGRPVDADHVCQVLAVIEQESGYDPDPEVANLGRIAREAIEDRLDVLGPLAELGVEGLLSPTAEDTDESFGERLEQVRTERELDLLFQDLADHHTRSVDGVPVVSGLVDRKIERLNPVTTAGSMQVSVRWAQQRAEAEDLPAGVVRELLYTRAGGVRWGTARLFAGGDYDDPLHRFADFNAGPYASRNAAFQAQLSELTALELSTDGDLMRWTKQGRPRDGRTLDALLVWRSLNAPDLPEGRVRRDARLEKNEVFEHTRTWTLVRESYREMTGTEPTYAQVPDIDLDSPKITRDWTTEWFAEQVARRYRACLARG